MPGPSGVSGRGRGHGDAASMAARPVDRVFALRRVGSGASGIARAGAVHETDWSRVRCVQAAPDLTYPGYSQ
jgi:hypothetical protein